MSETSAARPHAADVSVILVNWNTRLLTEAAVVSLRTHEKSTSLEIIVVDNASTDGSADYLEARLPGVRVIRGTENEGFARANNRGVAAASGRHILLLNADTVSHEEVLPACLRVLKTHAPALVGCRLLNADGSLQLSADKFPRLRDLARENFQNIARVQEEKLKALAPPASTGPVPVDWLCGAFLLMERETYLRVGGLSPEIFMYGEDVEFCWRARRHGIRSLYLPDVSITHLGGGGIDHGSLRSLTVSDAGRLRSFALMRGRAMAMLLRFMLMGRSLLRFAAWSAAGLATGSRARLRKAGHHGFALLVLAGLPLKAG